MIIIKSISDKYFSLNGVEFAKIYQPLKQGVGSIGIYNVFDVRQQLISSTYFDEFLIDGVIYGNANDASSAILGIVYSNDLSDLISELSTKLNKGGYAGTAGDLKTSIEAIEAGIRGSINPSSIAPTENGIYRCEVSGTYVNFGGLVIDLDNKIVNISVKDVDSTPIFVKIETDLSLILDALPTKGSLNSVESGGVFESLKNVTEYNPYNGLDDLEGGFIKQDFSIQNSAPYSVTGFMRVFGTGITLTNTIKGLGSTIYNVAYDQEKNPLYSFQILPASNHSLTEVYTHNFLDDNVAYIRMSFQNIDLTTFKLRSIGGEFISTDILSQELKEKEIRLRVLESESDSSQLLSYRPELYDLPNFIKSSNPLNPHDIDVVNGTVSGVYDKFNRLVDAHKSYFRKKERIGQSQAADVGSFGYDLDSTIYDINLYEIGKFDLPLEAPTMVIQSGLHGYENSNVVSIYYFVRDLLENFKKSKMLKYIHDNCRILVVPLVNPWGWENNQRENSRQVDINRNFDYRWSEFTGGSKGSFPMSESESQAIVSFIESYPDVFCYYDFHARGQELILTDERFTGYTSAGDLLTIDAFVKARTVVDSLYLAKNAPIINPVVILQNNSSGIDGFPALQRWLYYTKGISSSNPESVDSMNNEILTLHSLENNRQQTHYVSLLIQYAFKYNLGF